MPDKTDDFICPLKHLADTFGGKWKLSIICILSDKDTPKRYSVIKRRLGGITNMMLSQSLHELEASGMIHREQFNEIPPRVEYSLTDRGKEALPFLEKAGEWAVADMMKEGRQTFCSKCVTVC